VDWQNLPGSASGSVEIMPNNLALGRRVLLAGRKLDTDPNSMAFRV
jgi:hypothetical protein